MFLSFLHLQRPGTDPVNGPWLAHLTVVLIGDVRSVDAHTVHVLPSGALITAYHVAIVMCQITDAARDGIVLAFALRGRFGFLAQVDVHVVVVSRARTDDRVCIIVLRGNRLPLVDVIQGTARDDRLRLLLLDDTPQPTKGRRSCSGDGRCTYRRAGSTGYSGQRVQTHLRQRNWNSS